MNVERKDAGVVVITCPRESVVTTPTADERVTSEELEVAETVTTVVLGYLDKQMSPDSWSLTHLVEVPATLVAEAEAEGELVVAEAEPEPEPEDVAEAEAAELEGGADEAGTDEETVEKMVVVRPAELRNQ